MEKFMKKFMKKFMRSFMKKAYFLSAVLWCLLALAACGKKDDGPHYCEIRAGRCFTKAGRMTWFRISAVWRETGVFSVTGSGS